MNIVKTWQTRSTSSGQTEQLGEQIGNNLRGGEVIELISDLGGGKTTFTRGLVRGAGSDDAVASPTFTLSKEYVCPGFHIVHYDFYRLGEAGIVGDELAETTQDKQRVIVVEWGDIVQNILPDHTVRVTLQLQSDGSRLIICQYPETRAYLFVDIA